MEENVLEHSSPCPGIDQHDTWHLANQLLLLPLLLLFCSPGGARLCLRLCLVLYARSRISWYIVGLLVANPPREPLIMNSRCESSFITPDCGVCDSHGCAPAHKPRVRMHECNYLSHTHTLSLSLSLALSLALSLSERKQLSTRTDVPRTTNVRINAKKQ